jgi:protein SCO1/2
MQLAVGRKKRESRRQKAEGGQKHLVRFLLLFTAYCLLPAAYCFSQGRMYDGSAPLYSPRSDPNAKGLPAALQEVKIEQRLNEQIPLDLQFKDETGRTVRLSDYFNRSKPVILSLVYFRCPMLCDQVLTAVLGGVRSVPFDVGKDFDVLTISFDPHDTPEYALEKKERFIERYNRPGAEKGWHFLTGDQESIRRLTDAVGFRYSYDEKTNQFAHASGIMVLTPEGKLSRYFYGLDYDGRDLRLGLVEASSNKIGSYTDQLLLYCYHYDPATGKYGPVVMNIMRLGGIATVICTVGLLLILRRRSAKKTKEKSIGERAHQGGAA